MRKNLNTAQNFLDKDIEIPEAVIRSMSEEERAAFRRMKLFGKDLEEVLEREISTAPFRFSPGRKGMNPAKKSVRRLPKFSLMLPAAVLFSLALGFPLYYSVQSREHASKLIVEETNSFVTTLTDTNSWWESTVDDSSLSTDWFTIEPATVNTSF